MRRPLFIVALLLWLVSPTIAMAQRVTIPLLGFPASDAIFDDSVVQDVRLQMNAQDWQALKDHYLDNTYYPADFYWRNHVVRNVGIKSRGTGSRSPVKPGLKVSFDKYVSGQQFLGLASLVLRNNTQDPSNMRERLSMRLFQRMGLPASREAYARFYVNDEYMGLYTVVEAIDDRFLARHFADSTGYLYSFDYPAGAPPFYFDDRGDDIAAYLPQPFKPENHESAPRGDVIVRMVQAVNQSSDAAFRLMVDDYVDLPATMRHLAVETFLGDNDGFLGDWGMNNTYLYREPDSTRFSFLVWDKSNAFLQGVDGSIWHNLNDVPPEMRNRLVMRALASPDLMTIYLDALAECAHLAAAVDPASPTGAGWFSSEVEREYLQIRGFALADTKKPFTNAEFEQAVQDARDFAAGRSEAVLAEVLAVGRGRLRY